MTVRGSIASRLGEQLVRMYRMDAVPYDSMIREIADVIGDDV